MLPTEANRHSVVIITDVDKGLPKVKADRVQLQQALMNLMLNGIEAMRDISSELRIKAQRADDGQLLISSPTEAWDCPLKILTRFSTHS